MAPTQFNRKREWFFYIDQINTNLPNNNVLVNDNLEISGNLIIQTVSNTSYPNALYYDPGTGVIGYDLSGGGGGSWVGTATTDLNMSNYKITTTTGYSTYQSLGTNKIINLPSNTLKVGGVNVTSMNKRTRTSHASSVKCVSTWTTQTNSVDNKWISVCWAPELLLFCAVAETGIGNRVMTSPNGINWTTRTSAADNEWCSVCWAAELGLFCAVSYSGTNNDIMTSSDGITWTIQTTPTDNQWSSVCWAPELSLFCVVSWSGLANRVMTSPDGITWTTQTSAVDNTWNSVCWASELQLFCAVASSGVGNRVMTSPDGITWTAQTSALDNNWKSVCWSSELGLFCAVSMNSSFTSVMTSPDGITWTTRTSAAEKPWKSICWAPELGLFCAISWTVTANLIMTSPDGITWTTRTSAADSYWNCVCWAPELSLFCAVSQSGTANRVMTTQYKIFTSKNLNSNLDIVGNIQASRFIGDVSASALTVNSAYQMPTTIGSANQVLTVPASGNVLTFTDNTSGWIGTATSDLNMSNYNITNISELRGGSTMIIDPAAVGDNTGLVIIKGGLQVDGSSTIINSSILDISDHTILLASAATNVTQTYGAGIEISGNKTFTYESGDIWNSNIGITAPKFIGDVSASALTVNSAYQMPTTIGSANQVLTVPASGNILTFTDNTSGWIGTATSDLNMETYNITTTSGYSTYQSLGTNKIINTPSNTLKVGGVNISAINKRTRTSHASAVKCVSTWITQTSAADNQWRSVCWAAELGLFCAVSVTGTGNRVMTSPDGITWTTRTSPADNLWESVCWAAELGLFCAVSYSGTGNRVMTSPDGITWTTRTSAVDNSWLSVCWAAELGLFCAVAESGTGNRVMTSPDGITWTARTTNGNQWKFVCWAPELGIFCAVAESGTGNRVMTSPDGITWTTRTSAADNGWFSVCWAPELGLFCAVSYTGTGNRVMTSPDGITWTTRTSAADNFWRSVCWAAELGLFCAVADTGSGNRVMTSPDGITWTARTTNGNAWRFVCWAPELSLFCAVSESGTGNRVMTTQYKIFTSKNIQYASEWIGTATTDLNMSNFNITGINQLQGASTMILDPAGVGDNTGLVVIKGNLQVDGTTTTINSSILDISDHTILLASNATATSQTYGAGLEISGNKTFTYESGDIWNSNIGITAPKFTGDISASALTVNSAYQMPTTIGSANQVLTVPVSGNTLTFTTPSTGGATEFVNTTSLRSTNATISTATNAVALGQGASGTGNSSVAIGYNSLADSTESVSIGSGAGSSSSLTTGICIGRNAGVGASGSTNINIGNSSGWSANGSDYIAIGTTAGRVAGTRTISIGKESGNNGTRGTDAIAMGYRAGYTSQGDYTLAIGGWSAYQNQGSYCIAIGNYAGYNYQKTRSIALGPNAGKGSDISNYQDIDCVAIGYDSARAKQGANSVAIGSYSSNINQAPGCVSIGAYAGQQQDGNGAIAIGNSSGNRQGEYSIAIGAGTGTDMSSNAIAIGRDSVSNTSSISIGRLAKAFKPYSIVLNATGIVLSSNQNNAFYVKPIRNDATPTDVLFYNTTSGEISYGDEGQVSSDMRLKTNIEDVTITSLDIIKQLQIKKFIKCSTLYPSEEEILRGKLQVGVIAQEIMKINPELVSGGDEIDSNGNLIEKPYFIKFNDLAMYHIKATQELTKELDLANNKIQELETQNNILKSAINSLLKKNKMPLI